MVECQPEETKNTIHSAIVDGAQALRSMVLAAALHWSSVWLSTVAGFEAHSPP